MEKGEGNTSFRKEFQANTSGFINDPIFTKLKKLTPIILIIALLLFFISFGSPYWAESSGNTVRYEHIGLWRYCAEDNFRGIENCDDFINYNYNDWLESTQTLVTLSMFSFFVTIPAYIVLVLAGKFGSDRRILVLAIASSGATVGLLMIGMCCFAFRYDEYFWQHDRAIDSGQSRLAWAFYLALVSLILSIIAPILVALEVFADKYLEVDTDEQ